MKTFTKYNTLWTAEKVTTENSDKGIYQWEKVTAVWSGVGPRPAYANEPRTFFFNKRQVKDFSGNPLEAPRYIN